ncbi:hypothetical protein A3Q56_02565 [Intoshia linei]|uniref:carnosine N-methyltransferase n=1 Tax=Intoshia linei TaxID=1819745 RepID=A0A177B6F6_9BILA|nr:hypothetical protein A3Q56_02565 [Intoshia linei]
MEKKNQVENNEEQHFRDIVHSFKCYSSYCNKRLMKLKNCWYHLPDRQRNYIKLLFREKISSVEKLILENQKILDLFDGSDCCHINNENRKYNVTFMDKVVSCFKQIMRDWSDEGATERIKCYDIVIQFVKDLIPIELIDNEPNQKINILVPGAGLGRIVFELAKLGYYTEGNEFSLHIKLKRNECTIYPWLLDFSNQTNLQNQLKGVKFPDVDISQVDLKNRMSFTAGEFLEVYANDAEKYDCIVTIFFIDTAHNVVDYCEAIFDILKPGGYWINFGPLLYHFDNMPKEASIELNFDELKLMIEKIGFKFTYEKLDIPCSYVCDKDSMLQYIYKCANFVCKKC